MKNRITEESVKSLQQEGLKFSVDTLAEKLKISKKTIYKYFPDKEALAVAVYEKFYTDLKEKFENIINSAESDVSVELLMLYFDSAKMVRKEIFNKYSLNDVIENAARRCHSEIWDMAEPYVCADMKADEAETFRMITDGAFDRAIACGAEPQSIIRMLIK